MKLKLIYKIAVCMHQHAKMTGGVEPQCNGQDCILAL